LKGADLEQAQNALAAILEVLGRTDSGIHGASFAGGATGVSLLFAYQSVALGEPRTGRSRTLALDLMDRALNQAHLLGGNPGLFSGYSGLGWTLDHFRHMGLIHEDADLNQELDEALLVFLDPGTWRGLPELVDGLAGIGIYALDRNGEGRAEALLERVLILLSAKVERHMDGLAWYDDPELLYLEARNAMPDGLFNLGVSHGNPGVAGFLAGAAKLSASAQGLLDGAIRWLLAQKEAHEDGSQYGAGYGRHDRSRNPDGSRLAWCYGDLGIALVLLLAARSQNNLAWEQEALALGRACCLRRDPFLMVEDAGLCHGAFGNAHLFNRLFQASGDPLFEAAALAMYRKGLGMRHASPATAGFLPRSSPGEPAGVPFELLRGIAGIGLALLAATTPVEPRWDRTFLAHVTPKEF
jgi:lantibiotic modifying enzyme